MTISPLLFNVPLVQSPLLVIISLTPRRCLQHIIRLTLLPFAPQTTFKRHKPQCAKWRFSNALCKTERLSTIKERRFDKVATEQWTLSDWRKKREKTKWKLCELSFVFTPKISSSSSYFPNWIALRRRLQWNITRWDMYNSNRLEVESTVILPLLFSRIYTTIFCWRK